MILACAALVASVPGASADCAPQDCQAAAEVLAADAQAAGVTYAEVMAPIIGAHGVTAAGQGVATAGCVVAVFTATYPPTLFECYQDALAAGIVIGLSFAADAIPPTSVFAGAAGDAAGGFATVVLP